MTELSTMDHDSGFHVGVIRPVQQGEISGMTLYQHVCGHPEWWPTEAPPTDGGCDACESGSPNPADWRVLYAADWPEVRRG